MCAYICIYMHMHVGTQAGQIRGLESQVIVIYLLWVLGTELRSSWRVVSILKLLRDTASALWRVVLKTVNGGKARIADRLYSRRKASLRGNTQYPSSVPCSDVVRWTGPDEDSEHMNQDMSVGGKTQAMGGSCRAGLTSRVCRMMVVAVNNFCLWFSVSYGCIWIILFFYLPLTQPVPISLRIVIG